MDAGANVVSIPDQVSETVRISLKPAAAGFRRRELFDLGATG